MAWWVEALEIAAATDSPTGRWRLTAKSDEDGGGPHALCTCENGHATEAEARDCPEAQENARKP